MLMNLPLVCLNMLDIFFGIDITIVISLVLRSNCEVIVSIISLFGRILGLVKRFH